MKNETAHSMRAVVVGGGVIGLAVAWRLSRAGATVTLLERRTVGRGASWVAGGMLGAVAESGFEDEDLLAYSRASLERYPSFVEELAMDSGMAIPLDLGGTLVVGVHRDDIESLRRTFEHRSNNGMPVEWLTAAEARRREPLLSPRITAGMWIPGEGQVDHRALVRALIVACRRRDVFLAENTEVTGIRSEAGALTGVEAVNDYFPADCAIVAAGCWSHLIGTPPESTITGVRPVKGQIITLEATERLRPAGVVRAPGAYIIPKADGRLLIGATQEEMGFDDAATAGPVMDLLTRAWEAMPSIYEHRFDCVEVGLRPGSRDHRPLVGETRIRGLIACTGHYRHGILLAPLTADDVSEGVIDGRFPDRIAGFSPNRFQKESLRRTWN